MPQIIPPTILPFIHSIGIDVIEGPITDSCFLPGLRIDKGRLLVDVAQLLYPGDLLHEAGHIALVPREERHTLMDETIGQRPNAAAEEMAAIAWSWAAGKHLQLAPEVIFHAHGYQGGGSNIIENFQQERYFGVPYLHFLGLCFDRSIAAETPTADCYPTMRRWTID